MKIIRKILVAVISIAFVLFLSLRLWLITAVLLLLFVYFSRLYKKLSKLVFVLLAFVLSAAAINVFFFEAFIVPSNSMSNTIHSKDLILVNKTSYGARMPKSAYQIPFINYVYFLFKPVTNTDTAIWNYKRLKGFSEIKQNDIIVFNNPTNELEYYVKRCVALPGDNFKISNDSVFINEKFITFEPKTKFAYEIFSNNRNNLRIELEKLKIRESLTLYGTFYSLDFIEKKKIGQLNCIDSIKRYYFESDILNSVFPNDSAFLWTKNNFGSILIPKKNMTIDLNRQNYILYKNIIEKYEKQKIIYAKNNFYIRNSIVTKYCFKNNYYFMLGDNRDESKDSRYWGFVPEKNIVGKFVSVITNKK
ncbi:MAG: signal peptidase I [Bacteroidota bacterium]|nr:signal peptidase I [Bacteroidota bacterium]